MDEIFLTDKCVLLVYPWGASGKLLSNCLALNDAFVYQHVNAVFDETPADRFSTLMREIEMSRILPRTEWCDLNMGDEELFGIQNYKPGERSVHDCQRDLVGNPMHYDAVKWLIGTDRHFFRVCHTPRDYGFYREMWPNANQILFANTREWISIRNMGGSNHDPNHRIDESVMRGGYAVFDCLSLCSWERFMSSYTGLLGYFNAVPANMHLVNRLYDEYMKLYFNRYDYYHAG